MLHDQAEQYVAVWAAFERLERVASHRGARPTREAFPVLECVARFGLGAW
jgi:hypothetical protein